jgi:membrane protein required for colicin V production
MNWLDIILALILVASIGASFRKGLTREIIGLASVILALLLAIWFYGSAGAALAPYMSSRSLANLLGFFVIFAGVWLVGALASFILGKFLKVTGLSIVDHALGAVFGALRGILISIALIMAIMAFSQGDRPPDAIVRSRIAPYVTGAARAVSSLAPHELKEGFRRTYAQVTEAWKRALEDEIRRAPGAQQRKDERQL